MVRARIVFNLVLYELKARQTDADPALLQSIVQCRW
jgi:hypothetical protein